MHDLVVVCQKSFATQYAFDSTLVAVMRRSGTVRDAACKRACRLIFSWLCSLKPSACAQELDTRGMVESCFSHALLSVLRTGKLLALRSTC